jgi:hypothetical protein
MKEEKRITAANGFSQIQLKDLDRVVVVTNNLGNALEKDGCHRNHYLTLPLQYG